MLNQTTILRWTHGDTPTMAIASGPFKISLYILWLWIPFVPFGQWWYFRTKLPMVEAGSPYHVQACHELVAAKKDWVTWNKHDFELSQALREKEVSAKVISYSILQLWPYLQVVASKEMWIRRQVIFVFYRHNIVKDRIPSVRTRTQNDTVWKRWHFHNVRPQANPWCVWYKVDWTRNSEDGRESTICLTCCNSHNNAKESSRKHALLVSSIQFNIDQT